MAEAASPSSHSSFCEEVFSVCVVAGTVDPGRRGHRPRLQPNEVDRTNILAPGFSCLCGIAPSSRLHLRNFSEIGPVGSCIQLQQRNCSRVSRDFLRQSTFPSSQRTGSRSSGLRFERQDYLISCQPMLSCRAKSRHLWLSNQRFLDFARNDNKPCALSFT